MSSDPVKTTESPSPPVHAGAIITPKRQPVWPTVIGVFSITIGALGLLNYGCNSIGALFTPRFMDWMTSMMPQQLAGVMEEQGAALEELMPLTIAANASGAILSALLLWAGISTTKRHRAAAARHYWWSGFKVPHAVFISLVAYLTTRASIGAQAQLATTGGGSGPPQAFYDIVAVVTGIGYFIVLLAYPVFLVIWFRRRTIREQVASWGAD